MRMGTSPAVRELAEMQVSFGRVGCSIALAAFSNVSAAPQFKPSTMLCRFRGDVLITIVVVRLEATARTAPGVCPRLGAELSNLIHHHKWSLSDCGLRDIFNVVRVALLC